MAVDNHQQLQQQLLKARGYYHLQWLGCQLQLLGPVLTALVSYKLWRDWLRIPGETWAVLKSKTRRAQLLRCCSVLQGGSGKGGEELLGRGFQGAERCSPRGVRRGRGRGGSNIPRCSVLLSLATWGWWGGRKGGGRDWGAGLEASEGDQTRRAVQVVHRLAGRGLWGGKGSHGCRTAECRSFLQGRVWGKGAGGRGGQQEGCR